MRYIFPLAFIDCHHGLPVMVARSHHEQIAALPSWFRHASDACLTFSYLGAPWFTFDITLKLPVIYGGTT